MTYVFSEEIYIASHGKTPKKKGVWTFGDRNKTYTINVGSKEEPLTYKKAKEVACKMLIEMSYPMYKTIYLHSMEVAASVRGEKKVKQPKQPKQAKEHKKLFRRESKAD